jgi:hypothetical protein
MHRVLLALVTPSSSAAHFSFLTEFVSSAPPLLRWADETATRSDMDRLLEIWLRLLSHPAERLQALGSPLYRAILASFTGFMARTVPLAFKTKATRLLVYLLHPLLCVNSPQHVESIRVLLNSMVVDNFPLRSTDLPAGSSALAQVCVCV